MILLFCMKQQHLYLKMDNITSMEILSKEEEEKNVNGCYICQVNFSCKTNMDKALNDLENLVKKIS